MPNTVWYMWTRRPLRGLRLVALQRYINTLSLRPPLCTSLSQAFYITFILQKLLWALSSRVGVMYYGSLAVSLSMHKNRARSPPQRTTGPLPLRSKMRNWSLLHMKDCSTQDELYMIFNSFFSLSSGMISCILYSPWSIHNHTMNSFIPLSKFVEIVHNEWICSNLESTSSGPWEVNTHYCL